MKRSLFTSTEYRPVCETRGKPRETRQWDQQLTYKLVLIRVDKRCLRSCVVRMLQSTQSEWMADDGLLFNCVSDFPFHFSTHFIVRAVFIIIALKKKLIISIWIQTQKNIKLFPLLYFLLYVSLLRVFILTPQKNNIEGKWGKRTNGP